MYPVSDEFKEQIKRPHKIVAKVEVLENGVAIEELPIHEGNVTVDATSANRRRCNIQIAGEDYVPKDLEDLLHPLSGHELKPYRGLRLRDGTEELVPQGVFGIEDSDIQDSGESLTVATKGFDRSKVVERARFTDLYIIAEGTNYSDAIKDLIQDRRPGTTFYSTPVTHTTPPMLFGSGGWSGGGDPWEKAQKMAESIGMELYFDSSGACRLRPVPKPSEQGSVWAYDEGPEAMFLSIDRKITREDVYNGVIAFGLNTSTNEPVRIEVWDDDPNSPTYYLGSFGKVPTFYRSTMLLTSTQVTDAADAHLRKVLGTPEQVQFNSIVNPAHEVGDVITINRKRAGVDNTRHVIDKMNVPMRAANVMNITCRERRA